MEEWKMELIASYHETGYTIEVYFPEPDAPDIWTIWVVQHGCTVGEFKEIIVVDSAYGMDQAAMTALEGAADAAVKIVIGRKLCAQFEALPTANADG
jgi:hypothetical protein